MTKLISRLALIAVGTLMAAAPAMAHVGEGAHGGFTHGFLHPMSGLDHMLAMIGVGLFAAQLGKRAMWLVPGAFVLMMVAGGLLGFAGAAVPFVELGIAASVVAVGLLLAFDVKLPIAAAMALIGGFAIFHGYAHGAELPAGSDAASYVAGFVLASALLHAIGIGLGLLLHAVLASPAHRVWAERVLGGAMSAAGLVLLSG